jgi:hypothetical protein
MEASTPHGGRTESRHVKRERRALFSRSHHCSVQRRTAASRSGERSVTASNARGCRWRNRKEKCESFVPVCGGTKHEPVAELRSRADSACNVAEAYRCAPISRAPRHGDGGRLPPPLSPIAPPPAQSRKHCGFVACAEFASVFAAPGRRRRPLAGEELTPARCLRYER